MLLCMSYIIVSSFNHKILPGYLRSLSTFNTERCSHSFVWRKPTIVMHLLFPKLMYGSVVFTQQNWHVMSTFMINWRLVRRKWMTILSTHTMDAGFLSETRECARDGDRTQQICPSTVTASITAAVTPWATTAASMAMRVSFRPTQSAANAIPHPPSQWQRKLQQRAKPQSQPRF